MSEEQTTEVKEITIESNGDTSTKTEITVVPRERVAVVKATPRRWWQSIATKLTVLVVGNGLFLFVWGQIELYRSFELPLYVHLAIAGLVLFASLIWIIYEIYDAQRYNTVQKEIDKLLVEQNSTPDNLAQLIPADQVELYRARGFKIITRGDPGVGAGPLIPAQPATPQGQ